LNSLSAIQRRNSASSGMKKLTDLIIADRMAELVLVKSRRAWYQEHKFAVFVVHFQVLDRMAELVLVKSRRAWYQEHKFAVFVVRFRKFS
jgi:hypothetical protein